MSGDKSIQYETKTLPSGIVVENNSQLGCDKYRWSIKGTTISHNEGEPAVEYNNGSKVWLQHDEFHRLDGPALEHPDGGKCYYIYGALCDEKTYWNHPEVIAYKKKMNKTTQYETKTLPSGIVIENKPPKGAKYRWVIKDTNLYHNEGEPAVENISGKYWFQHDKLHRLDGPAVESTDGSKDYYIDGVQFLEVEYWKHPCKKKMNKDKTTQYETKTLPSGIVVKNTPSTDFKYQWVNNDTNLLHNEGAAASECKNGNKYWLQYGKLHRLDGPAVEYADGRKDYYINHSSFSEENYWNHPEVIAYKKQQVAKEIQKDFESEMITPKDEYDLCNKEDYDYISKIAPNPSRFSYDHIVFNYKKLIVNSFGRSHSLNGPSVIWKNGDEKYSINFTDAHSSALSKEEWENHPDVIAYKKQQEKKKKTGSSFARMRARAKDEYDLCNKEDFNAVICSATHTIFSYKEYVSKFNFYYVNRKGQPHRLSGPYASTGSYIRNGGCDFYYAINGKNFSKEEYFKYLDLNSTAPTEIKLNKSINNNDLLGFPKLKEPSKTKQSFSDMLKSDCNDAAWRTGAKNITAIVKRFLIQTIGQLDSKAIEGFTNLMETEYGEIIVNMAIGMALTYTMPDNPKAIRLAKEFRVASIAGGMDQVASALVPLVSSLLRSLPQAPQPKRARIKKSVRVKQPQPLEDLNNDNIEVENQTSTMMQ